MNKAIAFFCAVFFLCCNSPKIEPEVIIAYVYLNEEELMMHILCLLHDKEIPASTSNSVACGIMVKEADAIKAEKILREDAKKHKYDIVIGNDKKAIYFDSSVKWDPEKDSACLKYLKYFLEEK